MLLPPGARPLGAASERARDGGVPALVASGLVVPRAVLARCGGFDEDLAPAGLAAVDLCFRIRDLGLRVDVCDDLDLEAITSGDEIALDRRGERAWRVRWAHRPAYLAGGAAFGGE
jgi:hypothetical protein